MYFGQMSVEREKTLREKFVEWGIKWILVDLDDTLIDTSQVYIERMTSFARSVACRNGRPIGEIHKFMIEVLNGLRSEFSVHPNLMSEVARIAMLRNGIDPLSFVREYRDLMEIYEEAPMVFDGVIVALEKLRDGVKIAVVTHSDWAWTEKKLARDRLHVLVDRVFSIPSYQRKDLYAWERVLSDLKVSPKAVFVFGDSWNSDVRPALEVGVPINQVVRIQTNYDHANKGKIEGVREVVSFAEAVSGLSVRKILPDE